MGSSDTLNLFLNGTAQVPRRQAGQKEPIGKTILGQPGEECMRDTEVSKVFTIIDSDASRRR